MNQFLVGRWVKVRLYCAGGVLASLFLVLIYRAYVLQVRESEHLKAMAEDQYMKDVELPPKRGRILDRNGAELAASAEVDSIYANPRLIASDAPRIAKLLGPALHMDKKDLEKKLHVHRYFAWLKRRVTAEEARAVKDLELAGVYAAKEPRRYYPNRALGGPVLGWAGVDAAGQEGLELQYDKWLRGARSAVPAFRDALGRAVLAGGLGDSAPQAGHDVYTTIDRHIQFRLERALENGVNAHHAKAGVAVALDPSNGEVLAMASMPTMNPNEPDDARERGVRNRSVTDPFEPGSTMKTFSITGALESKAIHITDNWYCENGRYTIGPATIHDAEKIGDVTTTEVLAKSSNICTAKIAQREGREKLHETLLKFGFGRPTGIDLPGERAGQVRSVAHMGPVETATMSFGQGITATPLQMATAYSTIANGGVWNLPHVVRRVVDGVGRVAYEAKQQSHPVVDGALAQTVRGMLIAVTQKGGTAEKLSLPGYTFAGKTGTAQKVDPLTRHYSTDKWASSFVGFAPAENPKIVLFVMVDEPQGTHFGSMVAGPIFQEVIADALPWLGVPPTLAPSVAVAVEPVSKKKVAPTPLVDAHQLDAESEESEEGGVFATSDEARAGLKEVPDFSGMGMSEALDVARRVGLKLEISGSGFVIAQSPGPGAQKRGSLCKLSFSPPS